MKSIGPASDDFFAKNWESTAAKKHGKASDTATQEVKDSVRLSSSNDSKSAKTRTNQPNVTKPKPEKKWTVLMYFAADNNLEKNIVNDALDAEWRGSNSEINVALQLDRGEKPSPISGGWSGAKRFVLKKGWDPENLTSPVARDLGQINMADPKNLTDFIKWGVKECPARHYMIVISSHGGGFEGAIDDRTHPDNPEDEGWMSLKNLKSAFSEARKETGVKPDLLVFDACLMGQAEVAYELRDQAKYMIASEETIGNDGLPYNRMLFPSAFKVLDEAVKAKIDASPEQVARKIIKFAERYQEDVRTLAAIDLPQANKMVEAVKEMSQTIKETSTPIEHFLDIMEHTQKFEQYGFKDLYDFSKRVHESEKITDEKLKASASNLMKALDTCIMANQNSAKYPDAHGLSANLIFNFDEESHHYREKTEFAKDSNWDEALKKMQPPPYQA